MLPDGFSARPLDLSGEEFPDGPDVDLATTVVNQAEQAIVGGPSTPRETVRALLTSPETLMAESRLFVDAEHNPVGLLYLELDRESAHTYIDAYATPAHATTLYPAILDVGMEAAARTAPRLPWRVESAAFAGDEPLRAALAARTFTTTRRFWRMRLDFDGPVEPQPAPDGLRVRPIAGEDDRQLLHALFEESFAQHFGFAPRPYDEWIAWHDRRRDSRPDLMWIAEDDGVPVAFCVTDDSRVAEDLAYIRSIGVIPAARGRGIARWLLSTAFAQAQREGRSGAALAVDSENTTGATRLYDSLGMRPTQIIDVFERSVFEQAVVE